MSVFIGALIERVFKMIKPNKLKRTYVYKTDQVQYFDQEFDELWDKCKDKYGNLTVRSSEFLNWRTAKHSISKVSKMVTNDMFKRKCRKVLVVVPHVDDETIGLGATLNTHSKNGDEIYCAYVTDRSASISEIPKDKIV